MCACVCARVCAQPGLALACVCWQEAPRTRGACKHSDTRFFPIKIHFHFFFFFFENLPKNSKRAGEREARRGRRGNPSRRGAARLPRRPVPSPAPAPTGAAAGRARGEVGAAEPRTAPAQGGGERRDGHPAPRGGNKREAARLGWAPPPPRSGRAPRGEGANPPAVRGLRPPDLLRAPLARRSRPPRHRRVRRAARRSRKNFLPLSAGCAPGSPAPRPRLSQCRARAAALAAKERGEREARGGSGAGQLSARRRARGTGRKRRKVIKVIKLEREK